MSQELPGLGEKAMWLLPGSQGDSAQSLQPPYKQSGYLRQPCGGEAQASKHGNHTARSDCTEPSVQPPDALAQAPPDCTLSWSHLSPSPNPGPQPPRCWCSPLGVGVICPEPWLVSAASACCQGCRRSSEVTGWCPGVIRASVYPHQTSSVA